MKTPVPVIFYGFNYKQVSIFIIDQSVVAMHSQVLLLKNLIVILRVHYQSKT